MGNTETRLMKMEVNNGGRFEQLTHKIQRAKKKKEKEEKQRR